MLRTVLWSGRCPGPLYPEQEAMLRALVRRTGTFLPVVLAALPERGAVVATDATGYSGRKRGWRETKHGQREVEDWVKVHAAMEVDELLVLSYELCRERA